MPKHYRSIELLGVPNYIQGTHDSLCTYYAAAMLLATLHPEYQDFFGRGARRQRVGLKVEDPLIKNFPKSKKESNDRVLSSWFYSGAFLKDACKALNATMKGGRLDTRFKYTTCTNRNRVFDLIMDNVNQGLPVMLGWTTIDFGVHCALVVGCRKASRRWFILHDPGGMREVCWEVLKAIDKSYFTTVSVEYHDGPRPDRLIVDFSPDNTFETKQIDRWWPYEGEVCYRPIAELYKSAKRE